MNGDRRLPGASSERLEQLEVLLGRVLVSGVVLSAVVLATGIIASLAGSPASAPLLRSGLIVLMATPILRVVVSLTEYVRLRDWFFSVTTLAVLLVLLTSVGLALRR